MQKAKTAKELVEGRNLKRYRQWHNGLMDRLSSKPCSSTNGDYLDGFYAPKDATIPDFLTQDEAARLRRLL